MTNYSLIFFTAFSVAAHAALIGLWPATDLAPLTPLENTIEIGLVSLSQVNSEFSRDRSRPKNTASLNKKQQTAQEPETTVIQDPPNIIQTDDASQTLCATSSATPTEPTATTNEESSFLPRLETGPEPDTSPVTATRSAPLYSMNPAPDYPANALLNGWEGEVWLNVTVSRSGAVAHISIEQSSNHRILDQAAIRTVQNWQFVPARIGDESTEGSVRIPIRFQIKRS